ncbi:Uncharacterized protein dnl_51150 [Desulfonema limicola]|uniref:Uncharacterized protein n=1 Tax=Desulfonema limicola TaxID=45656 RepID=A0A975BCB1_9BACT|nr:Uncharacterized protein dnl_51150 [Desulfonema limicola]
MLNLYKCLFPVDFQMISFVYDIVTGMEKGALNTHISGEKFVK